MYVCCTSVVCVRSRDTLVLHVAYNGWLAIRKEAKKEKKRAAKRNEYAATAAAAAAATAAAVAEESINVGKYMASPLGSSEASVIAVTDVSQDFSVFVSRIH